MLKYNYTTFCLLLPLVFFSYGDLVPKTKKGKIYTVAWTAVGLVFTSMIIGNLSSLLAIDFVFKPITVSSNGKASQ